MVRLLIERVLLLAAPFAAWFIWREVARRTGRPMGSTPWPWLFAAGAVLVGLSLMASAMFHDDNRAEIYVPAVTSPDGRVSPGHFEKPRNP
ncbi:MAG TPA: hypothetical protein VFW47_00675 [Phenylobacterium sp.]|nr:hypothetical protein [Phenylobacterium sp.]